MKNKQTPILHQAAGNLFILIIFSSFLCSCLSSDLSGENEEESNQPSKVTEPVPADGVLETVTWNLEWYGSKTHGPTDDDLQTENIVGVMDSLKADLYALQEVYSQEALDGLTSRLGGYRGFVAEHISWNQKTAFVFNTNVIDSVSSGALTAGQSSYDWANGRFPLFFRFSYSQGEESLPVYALVIHAKANTGTEEERQTSYERRSRAADSLYAYLQEYKPDAHIIILGDFNDDVDASIVDESLPSPYDVFANDSEHFRIVTQPVSERGESSYLDGDYSDLIDHIIISDELFPYYADSSGEIFFDALDFIPYYAPTTSDHLPVWARFDLRNK